MKHIESIRLEIFKWIAEQLEMHGEVLTWDLLTRGFLHKNIRVPLIGATGIWKPQILSNYPISITTSPNNIYNDDRIPDSNFFRYKYRGKNPDHPDNIGLKHAMQDQIPLIYFIGVDRGIYFTYFPVYIIGCNDADLSFTVAAEQAFVVRDITSKESFSTAAEADGVYRKREYITTQVQVRLHQQCFRARVIRAYRAQCALCRLKHIELLDAAHIIEDKDPRGEPVVSNGISLCKIHHAAFDKNVLGITPDYLVEIREDVLREKDGPMLIHGLIELHHSKLIVPRNELSKPNREFLEVRYQRFKNAS